MQHPLDGLRGVVSPQGFPRDLSRSAASPGSLPAGPANQGLMGVKYGLLASFAFGGRGEVHFRGNSHQGPLFFALFQCLGVF